MREQRPWSRGGTEALLKCYSSSGRSASDSAPNSSSVSFTGEEITYWPLAHLPRSMRRQRSLQKGKSGSALLTGFLQIGQRSLTVFRGMTVCIVAAERSDRDLQNSGDQVVFVGFGDLASVELAWLGREFFGKIVDENFAVNFGSV